MKTISKTRKQLHELNVDDLRQYRELTTSLLASFIWLWSWPPSHTSGWVPTSPADQAHAASLYLSAKPAMSKSILFCNISWGKIAMIQCFMVLSLAGYLFFSLLIKACTISLKPANALCRWPFSSISSFSGKTYISAPTHADKREKWKLRYQVVYGTLILT